MKAKFEFGSEFEILTKGELDDSLGKLGDIWREYAQGLKYKRVPFSNGTNGNVTTIQGPRSGFVWMPLLMGLNTFTNTADTFVVYIQDQPVSRPVLTAPVATGQNPLVVTWASRQLILFPGDTLTLRSAGGNVSLDPGILCLIECPAEQIFKLIGG